MLLLHPIRVLAGLTENDYIAFPDELTQEGMEAILPDSMENGENQGDAGNMLKCFYSGHYKLMNGVMALLLVWCSLRIVGLL